MKNTLFIMLFIFNLTLQAQQVPLFDVTVGAERMDMYIDKIQEKNIALVAHQNSLVENNHLVDVLLEQKIKVKKIFTPEHGFRGTAGAGERVSNSVDKATGIPIISLYGEKKAPSDSDLAGIDMVVFDLQDVGVRFYTYLSTLNYVMQSCAENNIPLIVLDRPNPNGFYIDGPILEDNYKSFVGMNPIPVVYGMTIGEMAWMINETNWLPNQGHCNLTVIPMMNYDRNATYSFKVAPSPNLPNNKAILLYPSLCFFEGTPVSVGRGTDKPFQVYGHPLFKNYDTLFTPKSVTAAPNPPFKNKQCKGYSLVQVGYSSDGINLQYLINAFYGLYKPKDFFNPFFDKLAGTHDLQEQIRKGMNEKEIRKSWQPGIDQFKALRLNFLLYPDFENQ